jgi:transposase-like protein
MGHKKAGVSGRRYTKEFKIEAVRLGQSVGYSEASRRLGMPESSLFNWVKLDRASLGRRRVHQQRHDRRRSSRLRWIGYDASSERVNDLRHLVSRD